MVNPKNVSRLGGITVAVGLGVAVTTGHGVASAETSTDGDPSDAPTTSAPEKSTNEHAGSSGAETSGGTAAQRTARQRRADAAATLREHFSVSPRHTTKADADANNVDADNADTDNADTDNVDTDNADANRDDANPVEVAKPNRKSGGVTAQRVVQRAEKPAVTRLEKQVEKPVENVIAKAEKPIENQIATVVEKVIDEKPIGATARVASRPQIAAPVRAAVTQAPAPVSVVTNLLTAAAARPDVTAPSVPQPPTLPRILEMAYAAWRRVVVSRLFNSTPTATVSVDYDPPDTVNGVVTGAVVGHDADNDKLTYKLVNGPATGTLDLADDGTFTYTPDTELAHQPNPAPVTFTVQVSDESSSPHLHLFSRTGHTTTATVTINIKQLNQAPSISVGAPDPQADGRTRFTVTTTDPDPDDESSLAVTWVGVDHGTVAPVTGLTNVYDYTPDPDYAHSLLAPDTDDFQFVVTDQYGKTGQSGIVTAAIQPVNRPADVTVSTKQLSDSRVEFTVTAADPDGDGVTVTAPHIDPATGSFDVTTPVKLQDGESATFVFAPKTDYAHELTGPEADVVTFALDDGLYHGSATANVPVTVLPINDPPDLTVGTPVKQADGSYTIALTATDNDGDAVRVTPRELNPAAGSWADLDADGSVTIYPNTTRTITFVPNPDRENATEEHATGYLDASDGHYLGTDTETVPLTIPRAPNLKPTFVITSVSAPDANTGKVTITYTKSDPDGDVVTLRVDPNNPIAGTGTFVDNGDGTGTYSPDRQLAYSLGGGTLLDSFTLIADDGHGHLVSETTQATIKFVNSGPQYNLGSYTPDGATTTRIVFASQVSDRDGDPVTISATLVDPTMGTLTEVPGQPGFYTFEPSEKARKLAADSPYPNYYAIVRVQVSDGFVVRTDDLGVTVQKWDNQPPNFTVTNVSDPNPDTGKVTISYTKSDPNGDPVTLTADPSTLLGAATFVDNGDGTATYSPDRSIVRSLAANQTMTDTFTIVASDGKGGSTSQSATAKIIFTNQKPYAQFENPAPTVVDYQTGEVHGIVKIVDPDGDTNLTFAYYGLSPSGSGAPGTLTFNPDTGEYVFIPKDESRPATGTVYAQLVVTVSDGIDSQNIGSSVLPIVAKPLVANPPQTPPVTPPLVPGGPGVDLPTHPRDVEL